MIYLYGSTGRPLRATKTMRGVQRWLREYEVVWATALPVPSNGNGMIIVMLGPWHDPARRFECRWFALEMPSFGAATSWLAKRKGPRWRGKKAKPYVFLEETLGGLPWLVRALCLVAGEKQVFPRKRRQGETVAVG